MSDTHFRESLPVRLPIMKFVDVVKKNGSGYVTFETQSDETPIRNTFRKLHNVSAILNILLLIDGTVLLIFNNTSKK